MNMYRPVFSLVVWSTGGPVMRLYFPAGVGPEPSRQSENDIKNVDDSAELRKR